MPADGWAREALAGAKPEVFWSDRADAPLPAPTLRESITADLTVIGAGFTGLWTAIQALEDEPGLEVVVLEGERCGFGASSRNGGFCDASLTHGLRNSLAHWPGETDLLTRLGRENLDGIAASVDRYQIEADFKRAAEIGVATEEWHVAGLGEDLLMHRAAGNEVELLGGEEMRARIHSPTYLGGLIRHSGMALLDPARMAWGMRTAAESLGAAIYEHSPALDIADNGTTLEVGSQGGTVTSPRVVMATNAYRGPVRRPGWYVIPVYDHVLMTEPLSSAQLAAIGWEGREGVGDVSNQFHYYRLSADNRILWGGYDATYHFNNGLEPRHDQSDKTHGLLAEHFFATFPQLEGVRFTHRWGGPIGTTSNFTATWGSAYAGRLVWVAGYTGLGVGASRFGARVALDLVFGRSTERTELEMVRKKPVPFPPEPLRWSAVQLTRKAIQRTDSNEGRRGMWLRVLDRFGVGFDS